MDNSRLAVGMFKLLDALQLEAEYKDGTLVGERGATLTTLQGLKIPFTVTIEKFFANEQCGILAHILGDLYIVMSYYDKTGSTGAYLIDGDKLYMEGVKAPPSLFISKTFDMRAVFEALRHSMVSAFTYRAGKWVPMRLPA